MLSINRVEEEQMGTFSANLDKLFKTALQKKENITTQEIQEIKNLIDAICLFGPNAFKPVVSFPSMQSIWESKEILPHCKDLMLLLISYFEINHRYADLKKYNDTFRTLSSYDFFSIQDTIFESHSFYDCQDFFKRLEKPDDWMLSEREFNWFYLGLYEVCQNKNKLTEDSAQLFFQSALLFLPNTLYNSYGLKPLSLEASKAFKYLKKASEGNNPIALFYCGFVEIHSSVLSDKSHEEKKNMLKNGLQKIMAAKNLGYKPSIVSLEKITPIAALCNKIDKEEEFFKYAMNSHNGLKNFLGGSPVDKNGPAPLARQKWYYTGCYHARKEKTDQKKILYCFYHSAAQLIVELTHQSLAKLDNTGLEKEFILRYLIEEAKGKNPYALFYKGFINLQLSRKIRPGAFREQIIERAKTDISAAMEIDEAGIDELKIGSQTVSEILLPEKSVTSTAKNIDSLLNQPRSPKKEIQDKIDLLSYFVSGRTTDQQSEAWAFSAELFRTFAQVLANEENLTAKDIQEIRDLIDKVSPVTLDTKDNLIYHDLHKAIIPNWGRLALLLINYFELNHQYTDLKKYNDFFKNFSEKHNLLTLFPDIYHRFEYNPLSCDTFLTLVSEKVENITTKPQPHLERLESSSDSSKWFYLGLYNVYQNNNKLTEDSAQLFFQSALLFLSRNVYKYLYKSRRLSLEISKTFKYLKKASEENNPIALFYCGFLEIHSSVLDSAELGIESYKRDPQKLNRLRKSFEKISKAKNQGYIPNMVSLKTITTIVDLFDKNDTWENFFREYCEISSSYYDPKKILRLLENVSSLEWYYTGLYEARKEKKNKERILNCFCQSGLKLIEGLTYSGLIQLDETGLEKEFILQYLIEQANSGDSDALRYKELIHLGLSEKIKSKELEFKVTNERIKSITPAFIASRKQISSGPEQPLKREENEEDAIARPF